MYRNIFARNLTWLILIPILVISIAQYSINISKLTLYSFIVAYGILTSFLISVYLKFEKAIYYLNKVGIEKATKEYNLIKGKRYIGIVIYLNNYIEKKALVTYLSAPMLLIESLQKEDKSYKLVIDPDYKKFDELVKDPNCFELYILGHGRLYRLNIGPDKKDTIWYRDFIGYPPKEKVVQLHCNHRDWFIKNRKLQSLTDILHANTDFHQKGMSTNLKMLDYLLDKAERVT